MDMRLIEPEPGSKKLSAVPGSVMESVTSRVEQAISDATKAGAVEKGNVPVEDRQSPKRAEPKGDLRKGNDRAERKDISKGRREEAKVTAETKPALFDVKKSVSKVNKR